MASTPGHLLTGRGSTDLNCTGSTNTYFTCGPVKEQSFPPVTLSRSATVKASAWLWELSEIGSWGRES